MPYDPGKESCPVWLVLGVRVQKVGEWPRVKLPHGTRGTVVALDIFVGNLRSFTVQWDNHPGYTQGVHHPGWHAMRGNVVPATEET